MNILSRVRGGRSLMSLAGVILLGLFLPSSILADTSYVGHWQCEWGTRDPTNRQPAGGGQFSAIVHPNFTFEATGAQGSGAGFQNFQARGQWELAEGGITLKGQMLVQIFGLVDFFFFSQPAGTNNLALTFTLENGHIHSNFCIRSG